MALDEEAVTGLRTEVERVTAFNGQDFVRLDELGKAFSFQQAQVHTDSLIECAKLVLSVELQSIPKNAASTLQSNFSNAANTLIKMMEWTPAANNANQNRSTLLTQIRQYADQAVQAAAAIVPYLLAVQQGGPLLQQLEDAAQTANSHLSEINRAVERYAQRPDK